MAQIRKMSRDGRGEERMWMNDRGFAGVEMRGTQPAMQWRSVSSETEGTVRISLVVRWLRDRYRGLKRCSVLVPSAALDVACHMRHSKEVIEAH